MKFPFVREVMRTSRGNYCRAKLTLTVPVRMQKAPNAITPVITAELKISVQPDRSAVFVDDQFQGHAGELGGAFHSMLLSPGMHRIKVELPGYRRSSRTSD